MRCGGGFIFAVVVDLYVPVPAVAMEFDEYDRFS